jgi:SAM-dependent methyltransferase
MSAGEVLACRNPFWHAFTGRVVVPWVLGGCPLAGEVLELGCGSGANAAALLDRFLDVRLTTTDVDPVMLASATRRLARFGDRATVARADATALGVGDATFDAVISMVMLHHVGDWPAALGEVRRVLRPTGRFVGYDLNGSGPLLRRRRERRGSPHHHYLAADELRTGLTAAGFTDVSVAPAIAGSVMRFTARRPLPTA